MAGAEYALDDPQVLADELVEPDFEDLLAEPAAAISLHLPEIEEASVYKPKEFDEAKHPRWPKGTAKAGQFMRAGESFMAGGKRWQVVSTAGNEVLAAEASGDVKNVEMKVFKPTQKFEASVKGAAPIKTLAKPKAIPQKWIDAPGDIPVGTKLSYASAATVLEKVPGGFRREGDGHVSTDDYYVKFNSLSGSAWKVIAEPGKAPAGEKVKGVAVPGIEVAPPKRIKGGAYGQDADFPVKFAGGENVTIVDPYVHSETHDPSIPVPAGSKLSAEDWKRFGKEDQTYYTELMGRFGAWKTQDASATMAAAYNHYNQSIRDAIYQGFKLQYGPGYWGDTGGGRGLSLAYLFTNANKSPALDAAYKKYEEAKVAMDEMNEVVHWDLYNRTRSPDITLFHGGGTPVSSYNSKFISGKTPIYAGYSQSYNFDAAAGWGNTISATPVRIPYVALSVYSQVPGMHMDGEREIAVGARMKLSDRSVVFSGVDMGMAGGSTGAKAVRKWINSQTKQQPAGGSIVEDLKAIWNGEGPIPIPEEALVLQSEGSAQGSTYKLPPPDWQQQAIQMAGKLKYKSDDGSKEHAVGILESMGLKPGDFIEGQKGARYVVIHDSGDQHGLRYVKLKSSSGVEVTDFSTSFPFSDSQSNEFFRLEGHLDLPKEKAEKGFTPFGPEQYAKLAVGAKTPVGKLKSGDLFKYDGEGYKVTGKIGAQVSIESLDTGKKYKGNTLGVVLPLVAMEGFHAPTDFVAGDRVVFTTDGGKIGLGVLKDIKDDKATVEWAYGAVPVSASTLEHAPEAPGLKPEQAQKGDKFSYLGVGPYTITAVLKSGTIKAKLSGKNVESFSPQTLAGSVIFRPSTFAMGEKVKLKTLPIGALVNGPSKKLHPYLVEGKANEKGQLVYLRNLETGVLTPVSGGKSYAVLHDAAAIQAQTEALPTLGSDKPGNVVFDPSKYKLGIKTLVGQLSLGDLFKGTSGTTYKIIGPSAKLGKTWLVEVVKPVSSAKVVGEQYDFSAGSSATPLLPKESLPFDHANLSPGDQATVSDLEVGDTFLGAPEKSDFIAPAGMKWVVSSKTLSGMKLKIVKPDGAMTTAEMDIPFGASYPVVYHGTNEYVPGKGLGGGAIDPSGLPMLQLHDDHPNALYSYDSFKWHKAGSGLKYPKLKSMAVGTVFTDKSDKAWKIKQAGAGTLVISDGKGVYAADPNWRGLVSDGSVAFIEDAALPEQQGTSDMPNLGALQVGDKFVMPAGKVGAGQVFEVVGPGASSMTMKVKNVETGTEHNFNKNATTPAAVVKKAQSGGPLQPGDPLTKAYKTYADLPVGLTFDHAGGKYTIIAQEPGVTTFTTPGGGETTSKPTTTLADVWTFVSGPEATTQPSLVGANLKDTFGVWGNVPVGTTFKAAGASNTIYTLSKNDAGDMVLTWGTAGSTSYAPTEPIAYMHYKILSLPPAPGGGFAVGDKLKSIYPTYGDLPEGVQFHVMPSGYSPEAAQGTVTWTVHREGGQVQVIPNTGPPFNTNVASPSAPVPDFWFAAEPDVDAAVAATSGGAGAPKAAAKKATVPSSELKVGDVFTIPAGSPKSKYKLVSMSGGPNGQAMVQMMTDQYGEPVEGSTPVAWGNSPGVPSVQVRLARPEPGPTVEVPESVAPKLPKASHGGFSLVGTDWVSPKSLDNFQFALTKKGKVVYKGTNGKMFGLGEQSETPALKVFPLKWDDPIPEPDDLEPMYGKAGSVPMHDLLSGQFFQYNGNSFLVVGKGPDGVTGMHLGDNKYVAFDQTNPQVTPMKPKSVEAVKGFGTVGETLKPGMVYKFAGGGGPFEVKKVDAEGVHVGVPGSNAGISILDPGAAMHEGVIVVSQPFGIPGATAPLSEPPKVGDKLTVFKTNGDIPSGTVVESSNAGPFTIKQASTMTHFLNSLGKAAVKDPKADKPFGLWTIVSLPGGVATEPGAHPKVGDEMLGDLSHLPIGTVVTAFKPPSPGGMYEITGYDKSAPRGVTVSFLSASGTPVPSKLADGPPQGSGSYWIKSLPGDKQDTPVTKAVGSMLKASQFAVGDLIKIFADGEASEVVQVGGPGKTFQSPVTGEKKKLGATLKKPDGKLLNVVPEWEGTFVGHFKSEPTREKTMAYISNMPLGTVFKNTSGDVFKVTEVTGAGAGTVSTYKTFTDGVLGDMPYTHAATDDAAKFEIVSGAVPGDQPKVAAKQEAAKQIDSPLLPYKYHKSGGGGYEYPKLGSLVHGTIFTDKTKTKYKVVSAQGDTVYFTKLADGDVEGAPQYAAPGKSFVHVLSAPDDISEARLVFTTSGHVALAA